MPVLSKLELFHRVVQGLQAGGWSVLFESAANEHPMRLTAIREGQPLRLLVYIWNLTHGGGAARPANEMRIQITGVTPPLRVLDDRTTLVLGWMEGPRVFAAFDPLRHRTFSTRSPSIQINRDNVNAVRDGGMSFYARGNGELAIALSQDLVGPYAVQQRRLHDYGDNAADVAVLEAAGESADIPPGGLNALPPDRRQVVTTVSRLARSSTFRQRVLTAYDRACAMCDTQLEMAQAAHIIPVPAPGSTDETSNGLALCPDHHIGYDRGMIGVLPTYEIRVSETEAGRLETIGLAGGIARFRDVRGAIRLPPVVADRPKPDYLDLANRFRRFEN